MADRKTGELKLISTVGEKCEAFLPFPLPPDPAIVWTEELGEVFDKAHISLGRLDSITTLLPDPYLFIYTYVRKEAVLSSQIEGTQSSLSDLLIHERGHTPSVPLNDVVEVSNYVSALDYGINRLKSGFPLCIRLIKEIHAQLLKSGRGSKKTPGEFRTSQNWIGGSRPGDAVFIPPPPEDVPQCMSYLEKFIHNDPVRTSSLVKAALVHPQFETIHPFLDGNGRIGRLLITLILHEERILSEPMLYLSLYFKKNREEYYRRLQDIRITGDWEGWLQFFANGVYQVSEQAVRTARELSELLNKHKLEIRSSQYPPSVSIVFDALVKHVFCAAAILIKDTGLSRPTVYAALKTLAEINLITEITEKSYSRMYVYKDYLIMLSDKIS